MRAIATIYAADLADIKATGYVGSEGRRQVRLSPSYDLFAFLTAAEARTIADARQALADDLAAREGSPGWQMQADCANPECVLPSNHAEACRFGVDALGRVERVDLSAVPT